MVFWFSRGCVDYPVCYTAYMLSYVLLIIGFVFLVKGAHWLIDGSASIAKRFNVSNIAIGLTIVAFGTSAPEFVVSTWSAYIGQSDLALTNIVGSVVTNILLGLGVAAVIYPLKVQRGTAWKEIPFSLLAILILFLLANDQLIVNGGIPQLSWIDGSVLIGFFIIFCYYTFGISKATPGDTVREHVVEMKTGKSIAYVLAGLAGLIIGGDWIVHNAVEIAHAWGVTEKFIGLLIVGPGTSLPELAATAMAAKKRNVDMAVGGIVGSNIFNIFWILGVSAMLGPIIYDPVLNIDMLLILIASAVLFLSLFIGKRQQIDRWQGAAFLVMYGAYITYLIFRG